VWEFKQIKDLIRKLLHLAICLSNLYEVRSATRLPIVRTREVFWSLLKIWKVLDYMD